ncbi:MAG: hypothetical protein HC803_10790 [Saprospiraceae bacterium]|nr:hypothetical protein [Saprospiraceae bacterium]
MSGWSFYDVVSPTGLTPAANIQQLNVLDPYYIYEDDIYANIICKIPASNPSQYEFVNVFSGNYNYDWQAGGKVDNQGRVHYFYQVDSELAQNNTITQGAFQTTHAPGDRTASIMYTILSASGAVEYSTLLGADLQNGNNWTYVAPYVAFVTDDCKAYIAGWADGDAYRYPSTPTYHDFETGTQKTVYDATPNPSGGGFITVFHEPTPTNTITDFASGNNTFCVGGLIYQNPNDGPINGQPAGYTSGDGSSASHNLPNISRNGAISAHPTPSGADYQWEKSYDGTNWQTVFGGNLEKLKPEVESNSGTVQYRRAIVGKLQYNLQ